MKDRFQWSNAEHDAFNSLKQTMTKAPILRLPDFALSFILETGASGVGIGAVLSQQGHPIAFFSKVFCPILLKLSTYICELEAIVVTVKKWLQYLLDHHFTIITDYYNLKELMTQVIQTLEQQMYMACLIGYNYDIQYRAGKSSTVVDVLSCIPKTMAGELLILLVTHFSFLNELKQELDSNTTFLNLQQCILT